MAESNHDLHLEVTRYLDNRGRAYETFLEDVVQDLQRFRDAGNADAIYRIYSRADKQAGGRTLKSVDGIVNKLRKWRSDGSKVHVREIHDIIGVTVVGYFNKDLKLIFDAIESNCMEHFVFVSRESKKYDGYYAEHFVVERRSPKKSFAKERQLYT